MRSNRSGKLGTWIAIASLVVTIATGAAVNQAMAAETATSSATRVATQSSVFDPICFDCIGGPYQGCTEGQHRDDRNIFPAYFKDQEENIHLGCTTSPDPDHLCQEHSWCSFGEELQEEAEELLNQSDTAPLLALISENESNLKVDLKRKELIVIGCTGKPIATLRLSSAQIGALRASENNE